MNHKSYVVPRAGISRIILCEWGGLHPPSYRMRDPLSWEWVLESRPGSLHRTTAVNTRLGVLLYLKKKKKKNSLFCRQALICVSLPQGHITEQAVPESTGDTQPPLILGSKIQELL